MISGLTIRNIRALRDSGPIPVKKLNILVGMNSSGKSTLIRMFPLLKQSVEVRTKGPILWYGRLVDFGSLKDVRSQGAQDEPVSFSFKLLFESKTRRGSRIVLKSGASSHNLPREVEVRLELDKSSNEAGRVSRVQLDIAGDEVSIRYGNGLVKSIDINGERYEPALDQYWYANAESKIPSLLYLGKKEGDGGQFYVENSSMFTPRIVSHLRILAHGNTSTEKLRLVAKQLSYSPAGVFAKQLSQLTSAPESLRAELTYRSVKGHYLAKLRALLLLNSLPGILREVAEKFESMANGVRYIEPVRASVERYYRLQDLAVDEIDSSGANTAMYLHSLDDAERERLTAWMKSNLGFYAYAEAAGGNVEIKVVVADSSVGRNVTDLGFGYSQILPVILQLWHSCIRRNAVAEKSPATVIAIEQPELHLHPRYQALLADVFASVTVSLDKRQMHVPIFIETHSEHIVNRVGGLVSKGIISADDVQVLLFESDGTSSTVKSVGFDADGVLEESWPLGFFIPEA